MYCARAMMYQLTESTGGRETLEEARIVIYCLGSSSTKNPIMCIIWLYSVPVVICWVLLFQLLIRHFSQDLHAISKFVEFLWLIVFKFLTFLWNWKYYRLSLYIHINIVNGDEMVIKNAGRSWRAIVGSGQKMWEPGNLSWPVKLLGGQKVQKKRKRERETKKKKRRITWSLQSLKNPFGFGETKKRVTYAPSPANKTNIKT